MMQLLRKVAEHVYFFYGILLFVLTMLVIVIPVWLLRLLPEPMASYALHPVFKAWMSVFLPLAGCPVFRKGKKNFKKGTNYVVVLNHNSLIDIPVSSPWIPGPNKTLAKAEMARIPLFSVIYRAGSILVDRKQNSSRRESYIKMQQMLEKGLHLCLYPEGTRNKTDKPLQPFYDGAFTVAIKAQKDIIPGLLFNTRDIYRSGDKYNARPRPIHIHFLEPVSTKGLTLEDATALKEKVYHIMETYYLTHKGRL